MPTRRSRIIPLEHESEAAEPAEPTPGLSRSRAPRGQGRPVPPPNPLETVTDRQRTETAPAVVEGDAQVMPAPVVGRNPVTRLMRQLSQGILDGTDLQQFQGEVERLVSGQEDRAQLFDNLMLTNDYHRLVSFVETREKLETFMLSCANRGDLSPAETLALMRYVDDQSKRIEDRVRQGAASVKDIMLLLQRVDFLNTLNERDFEKRLKGTTPQGREIARRLAIRMSKATKKMRQPPRREAVAD